MLQPFNKPEAGCAQDRRRCNLIDSCSLYSVNAEMSIVLHTFMAQVVKVKYRSMKVERWLLSELYSIWANKTYFLKGFDDGV
jgi:hypothetical protein